MGPGHHLWRWNGSVQDQNKTKPSKMKKFRKTDAMIHIPKQSKVAMAKIPKQKKLILNVGKQKKIQSKQSKVMGLNTAPIYQSPAHTQFQERKLKKGALARPRQSLSKASVGHHIPKGLKAKLQKDKSELDFPTVDTKTDSPKFDEMEIKTSEVIPPNAITLILTSGKQHCRQCFVSHTPCRKFCKHPKQFGKNIDLHKTFNYENCKKIDTGNLKLCGGGRETKIKAPKLRILAPGSNLGNMVATIFRSLNKYWFQYDYHIALG